MEDPLHILGPALEAAPTFEEAVRAAVQRFDDSAARFERLRAQLGAGELTEQEWRVVELAAEDVLEAAERAEEGYVAVQFDANAWYRIMENLDRIRLRLDSASGLLERALARSSGTDSSA